MTVALSYHESLAGVTLHGHHDQSTHGHGKGGPTIAGGGTAVYAESEKRRKVRAASGPEGAAEDEVLNRYETTDTHKRVNRTLRNVGTRNEKTETKALADAAQMDHAFDSMGVKSDREVVVWRGINGPMGRFKQGDTVVDD